MSDAETPAEKPGPAAAESPDEPAAAAAEPPTQTQPLPGPTTPGQGEGLPAGAGAGPAARAGRLRRDLYHLDFGVHKSLRYHSMRRRFLDRLHRFAMASSVIAAATAVAAVAGAWPEVTAWVTAASASMTLLDLVVGFNQRARVYDDLYRRFSDLAARIARVSDPTEEQVREWRAERLKLEADEPTPIDTLNVICHNLEVEARGLGHEHLRKVFLLNRVFAQLFTVRNKFPVAEPDSAPLAAPSP